MTVAIACPSCRAPADSLRGSPCRRPHLGAVYPCGCWLDLRSAARLAEALKAQRNGGDCGGY